MKKVGVFVFLGILLFSLVSVDAKLVNCKDDKECFIERAANCERSQLTEKSEFWFFGLIKNQKSWRNT